MMSCVCTWGVRRVALARQSMMDIPNHRSSHTLPTPRGGGVAFILVLCGALPFLNHLGFVIMPVGAALLGAGLFVALLGFFDDFRDVPPSIRLLGHFGASVFALYCLGGMSSLSVFGWVLSQGVILNILTVIYLMWLLNLYNFMDGIDGLAAMEAFCVSLGGALLYVLHGDYAFVGVPLALSASVLGFLWWNFPPARIFMGDAGSGFLGLIFGILSIQAAKVGSQFFWGWLILLGVFIADATITLFNRLLQGEKPFQAHRDHAYQHAARQFNSHFKVTMAVFIINVVWLWSLACLVVFKYIDGGIGFIIAYLPLIVLTRKFKSGKS